MTERGPAQSRRCAAARRRPRCEELFERTAGADCWRLPSISDIARGIALTDGLIGTLASADDESFAQQNRLLPVPRHLAGGTWRLGRAGRRHGSRRPNCRARRAEAGAELRPAPKWRLSDTRRRASPSPTTPPVARTRLGDERRRPCRCSPSSAGEAGGRRPAPAEQTTAYAGGRPQLKVNIEALRGASPPASEDEQRRLPGGRVRRHLPRQRDDVAARPRVRHGAGQAASRILLPAEILPPFARPILSILAPRQRAVGAYTLTLFGLQVPHRLLEGRSGWLRAALPRRGSALAGLRCSPELDRRLGVRGAGRIGVRRGERTTADLEESSGHGRRRHLPRRNCRGRGPTTRTCWSRPPERWGVATGARERAGARFGRTRGGAVSGLAATTRRGPRCELSRRRARCAARRARGLASAETSSVLSASEPARGDRAFAAAARSRAGTGGRPGALRRAGGSCGRAGCCRGRLRAASAQAAARSP